jgi:hypothetical protein
MGALGENQLRRSRGWRRLEGRPRDDSIVELVEFIGGGALHDHRGRQGRRREEAGAG